MAAALALLLVGCTGAAVTDEKGESTPGDATPAVPARVGTAAAALARLPVHAAAGMDGYDREEFGPAWSDEAGGPYGGDDCDTRNDVLAAQLKDVEVAEDGCTVLSGTLDPDPYTGNKIRFMRGPGTSTKIQIDHVVSLGASWRTGAADLSEADRALIGNHSLNLLAVDGPTNMGKGDADASEWLPRNDAFACDYVARQLAVKSEFGLWLTRDEKAAMGRVLKACPDEKLPSA